MRFILGVYQERIGYEGEYEVRVAKVDEGMRVNWCKGERVVVEMELNDT